MHQPAARVADGHVLDLLAGVELDVANSEGLAGDDGFCEPVRVLDELARPDDWRGLAGLPGAHRRLDLRVVRRDELRGRRSWLGLGLLWERRCPTEILVERSALG